MEVYLSIIIIERLFLVLESKGNYDNWEATLKHLESYYPANLIIKDIAEIFKGI